MRNSIFKFLIFFAFLMLGFFVPQSLVFAETTSIHYGNVVRFATHITNPNNVLGPPDGSSATSDITNNAIGTNTLGWSTTELPTAATLQSITMVITSTTGGSGASRPITVYSGGNGCKSPSPTVNLVSGTVSYTFTPAFCTLWGHFLPSDFQATFSGDLMATTQVMNVDSIGWYITYINYSNIAVSGFVVSSASGSMRFNASGDTKYTALHEKCKVSMAEFFKLTASQSANFSLGIVPGSIIYIGLDADLPRTDTGYPGGNSYLGYNFTSSISTWKADNVVMPYYSLFNTEIRAYTACWHNVTNADGSITPTFDYRAQGFDSTLGGDAVFQPDLISTPAALQNQPPIATPNCSTGDVWCSVEMFFSGLFNSFFVPSKDFAVDTFSSTYVLLRTKAPVAYVLAVLSTNFSPTGASTAVPAVTVSLPSHGDNSYIPVGFPSSIAWADTGSVVANYVSPFRDVFGVAVWFSFTIYCVSRIKRIF